MAYFKKVHPFLQLIIFGGIAVGCFTVFSFIGIFVLSQITGIDLMALSDPEKWDYSNPALLTFIRGMLVIQFISLFIIPVFLFARLCDRKPSAYLGLRSATPIYYVLGIIVLILALPLVNVAGTFNNALIPETTELGQWMKAMEESTAKQISFMLKRDNLQDLLLNLVFVAVFAGVGEELFFRGVLQRLFIKLFKSPWAGILAAAFIFSAIHLQFYGFIPRFILGVLLGAIYWYSGSLWPAIVAHFTYDAFAVIMIHFNPELADKDEVTIPLGNQFVLGAISAIVVAGILVIMKIKSKTTYEAVYARDNIDDSNPFV